ncbi:DMT family transporter [Collimonas pratensis]|uniref:EamA-like transporter family protein n=1 Tax=Collimonas pratensis TaxID=279113 RepID=A0ABM5Z6I9_9BURK|nr:DMT family transporter [Collimonas pratensis]AMP14648.1 eamA-like transporter family protein [Collimonas pratensis]
MHQGVMFALLAAALFGASTPFAKLLVGQVSPVMLAALLYLGSGAGLSLWYGLRRLRGNQGAAEGLRKADLPWLAAAILSGGIGGPLLLMFGLAQTPASSASLLLNMEGVLTALLAWFVFKENFDRRIALGMLVIVLAGVLLSWQQMPQFGLPWGPLAILAACLCWAIDNNLTRRISASDAVQIAALKGLVAGLVNLALALLLGASLPAIASIGAAALIGFGGYGLSLVLFVLALRHLGSARTGAYFSAAPFIGAAISLLLLQEAVGGLFWLAAALMAFGIWLHLTERHQHTHSHEEIEHGHRHSHDLHHQHEHDFEWDGREPHSHPHRHLPISHSHAHYPDIHHRHQH